MAGLLGFAFLFAACYCGFRAVESYRFFKYGIHTTATVREIEKTIDYHEDSNEEIIRFWLILDLPDYLGVKLSKKYPTPIVPSKYKIGEVLEIIQNHNAPTDIVVKKEGNRVGTPSNYLLLTITLLLLSIAMCYGGKN